MKLMRSIKSNGMHFMKTHFCYLTFVTGAVLGPGSFEIFSVKDRVFSDGRFRFEFDSFSWNDVRESVNQIELRAHPLMLGLYQFMKYSGGHRANSMNASAAYRFFNHNNHGKKHHSRPRFQVVCRKRYIFGFILGENVPWDHFHLNKVLIQIMNY